MDPNLRFWRAEGQSFLQRFLLWAEVLDPLLLLESADEIRKTRLSIQSTGKTLSEPIQNAQTKRAFLLSLSSVHPDTDDIIPVLFRPPAVAASVATYLFLNGELVSVRHSVILLSGAHKGSFWLQAVTRYSDLRMRDKAFLPISLPLTITSSLQHQARHSFIYQFLFHLYTTGFTLFNGNGTPKADDHSIQEKQIFLSLGAVSYAACIGVVPLVFMNRYTLKSPLTHLIVKNVLPAPLLGLMTAFTVVVTRSPEFDNGIEVMDRNGKVVGVSQKAGEKAVKETAISRAVLFGTTFFLPPVVVYLVERAKMIKTPRTLALLRMFVITSVLTGMLPVSLSMFPQCGVIKRADLEPEILSSTEETEFFYNRGI